MKRWPRGAELGDWCGFGGALLCLSLIRRPTDERRVAAGDRVHLALHTMFSSLLARPPEALAVRFSLHAIPDTLYQAGLPTLYDQEVGTSAPEPRQESVRARPRLAI